MTETTIPEPGQHVRIRRYQVPSSEVRTRKLDCDVEGTVRASWPHHGGLIELDPASVTVHYVSDGHDQAEPFGKSWRIGLGYVFLGQDPEHGVSWTLETEVEVDPEPAPSTTPLADALAEVDATRAEYHGNWSHGTEDAYHTASAHLAEVVRSHLLAHPERQS